MSKLKFMHPTIGRLLPGWLVFMVHCGWVMAQPRVSLEVVELSQPLIEQSVSQAAGIKYGNEGGEVVRDEQGTYHWFTSEQFGDPYWVMNRIAHWYSLDGTTWARDTTWRKEGNHDQTSTYDKSSYFDPTVQFDEETGYWYMFYVSYKYSPDKQFNRAKIYRSKAVRPGRAGLSGPYHDNDSDDVAVLEPLATPPPYEAKWAGDTTFGYGCASVTLYKVGKTWYMLWAENLLATAPKLSGTFTRLPEGPRNPVRFGRPPMEWIPDYLTGHSPYDTFYFENPVVYQIPKGRTGAGLYVLVAGFYTDSVIGVKAPSYGYATSTDGVTWSSLLPIKTRLGDCVTVCSFLPDAGGDNYTLYVTGRENRDRSYERFARLRVKLRLTR